MGEIQNSRLEGRKALRVKEVTDLRIEKSRVDVY